MKIPFDKVDQSQRYKDASEIIDKNIVAGHPINNVVGHSLGGAVSLKLVDKYPNHSMTTTTYGAPVKTNKDNCFQQLYQENVILIH